MKYKIDIIGKHRCTAFSTRKLEDKCVIISINDTGCDTVILENEKIISVCKTWFDDIDDKKYERENLKLMSENQAKEIKNFIDTYKNQVSHIVVHCTAGISRSGAVGCVIARYLNGDDSYLWSSGRYIPNKYVYKLMCKSFNLEYSDKLFENKSKLRYKGDRSLLKGHENYGVFIDDMFEFE